MLYRSAMTGLTLVASVLAAIGGANLLNDGQTTIGLMMLATAVVVSGIGVATWRWTRELTR